MVKCDWLLHFAVSSFSLRFFIKSLRNRADFVPCQKLYNTSRWTHLPKSIPVPVLMARSHRTHWYTASHMLSKLLQYATRAGMLCTDSNDNVVESLKMLRPALYFSEHSNIRCKETHPVELKHTKYFPWFDMPIIFMCIWRSKVLCLHPHLLFLHWTFQ